MKFRINGDKIETQDKAGAWQTVATVYHHGDSKKLVQQANEMELIAESIGKAAAK